MAERETATDRLARLLALIPWVVGHPEGVSVEQVCTRFEVTEAELARDLETVMMVGVHPFTPDTMIEAWISDGQVFIRFADAFARPLRLTADEAVALIAAASAVSSVPGFDDHGPLQRALARLDEVVGGAGIDVGVDLGGAAGDVFASLDQARDTRTQIEIDYPDHSGGDMVARVIEPRQLFSSAGRWYVSGWCHRAEANRVFRIDRIGAAYPTTRAFVHTEDAAPSALSFDDALPEISLEVDRDVAWLLDSVPVRERQREDRVLRVRFQVGSPRWLARLLIQLGPAVRVLEVDPSLMLPDLVAEEGRQLLARYR